MQFYLDVQVVEQSHNPCYKFCEIFQVYPSCSVVGTVDMPPAYAPCSSLMNVHYVTVNTDFHSVSTAPLQPLRNFQPINQLWIAYLLFGPYEKEQLFACSHSTLYPL